MSSARCVLYTRKFEQLLFWCQLLCGLFQCLDVYPYARFLLITGIVIPIPDVLERVLRLGHRIFASVILPLYS